MLKAQGCKLAQLDRAVEGTCVQSYQDIFNGGIEC